MKSTTIFPTTLIILDLMAAIGYMNAGNWRMTIYWTAAATLTAAITF